jgi:hypothetical protein
LLIGTLVFVGLLAMVGGALTYFWLKPANTITPGSGKPPWHTAGAQITATQAVAVNKGVLTLEYQNGNQNAIANQIQPSLKLTNTGGSPIALTDVTIRYWYTAASTQTQVFACDYATIGCENVRYKIVRMGLALPKADTYLEIGFSSLQLAAGASTEIKVRVHKSDWSNSNQSNDYSFMPGISSYSPTQQIGVYYQGELVSGSKPA